MGMRYVGLTGLANWFPEYYFRSVKRANVCDQNSGRFGPAHENMKYDAQRTEFGGLSAQA